MNYNVKGKKYKAMFLFILALAEVKYSADKEIMNVIGLTL